LTLPHDLHCVLKIADYFILLITFLKNPVVLQWMARFELFRGILLVQGLSVSHREQLCASTPSPDLQCSHSPRTPCFCSSYMSRSMESQRYREVDTRATGPCQGNACGE